MRRTFLERARPRPSLAINAPHYPENWRQNHLAPGEVRSAAARDNGKGGAKSDAPERPSVAP